MENETSKTRSLKTAFLLDPESLRRLQALLAEADGATEYRAKFDDGSIVKYDLVDDIIGQPNAGKKFIVGLITSAGGQGRSISLTMRGDPEPSVEYTMSGVQRDVVYFSDKLDDWIASCTQWYAFLHIEPWNTACPRPHRVAYLFCWTCRSRFLSQGKRLALLPIGSNTRCCELRRILGIEAVPACHICYGTRSAAKSTVRRDSCFGPPCDRRCFSERVADTAPLGEAVVVPFSFHLLILVSPTASNNGSRGLGAIGGASYSYPTTLTQLIQNKCVAPSTSA